MPRDTGSPCSLPASSLAPASASLNPLPPSPALPRSRSHPHVLLPLHTAVSLPLYPPTAPGKIAHALPASLPTAPAPPDSGMVAHSVTAHLAPTDTPEPPL